MRNRTLNFFGRRSVPILLQSESAECGLACLAMVASHYGHHVEIVELRQRLTASTRGASLATLVQFAEQLHFMARPIKIELQQIRAIELPAILHWNLDHFVVLVEVGRHQVTIHDPAQGRRTLTMPEFSASFTGIALQLLPAASFELREKRPVVRIRDLLGHMLGLRGTVAEAIILAAVLEVLAVAMPLFMQLVVDNAVVSNDRDLVAVLGVGFLLLVGFQVVVRTLRTWVSIFLGTHVNLQLVNNLFSKLIKLPVPFFERRSLGDVISRFDSTNAIQRTITGNFLEGCLDGVMSLVTLAIMLMYSWQLAAIVFVAMASYWGLRFLLFGAYRQASEEHLVRAAKQQGHFLETMRGIQSIKLFNRQIIRTSVWRNLVVDTFNAAIRLERLAIPYHVASGLLFGAVGVVVVWLGALMVLDNALTVGALFAFVAYKQQFIQRMDSLVGNLLEYRTLELHRSRVSEIALSPAEPEDPPGYPNAGGCVTEIEVDRLSFRYADELPFVLEKVSFRVGAGESLAIVGPSGCGKTTLLKLMLGLLEPSEGEVRVGGIPLNKIGYQRYRDWIGAVMQDDLLFAGSIAENISFFDPHLDMDQVEASAIAASIASDVHAMPLGFHTLVGDMGSALSGGQKQRILLARALYRQPKILYLDEATSHLDAATESSVNRAVQALHTTRVIIAHRPSTIEMADRVFDLAQSNLAYRPSPLA